jgi:hypothetical protein
MNRQSTDEQDLQDSYWRCSKRPLEVLVFLFPFIVIYELCLLYVLRDERGTVTNSAHEGIIRFFGVVDIDMLGLSLPGVAVILVLLIWHLLLRRSWALRWNVFGLMFMESVLWTIPLLVFSRVIHEFLPMVAGQEVIITELGTVGRIAISIGAGLYEELLFRMLVIGVIHTILVDALGLASFLGTAIAVGVSAVLFTEYHPLLGVDGSRAMGRVVFYLMAGLFFGVLFVSRGFGVVVAVHAFYDIVIMLAGD